MICPHCNKETNAKKSKADFKVKAVGKNGVKLTFATAADAADKDAAGRISAVEKDIAAKVSAGEALLVELEIKKETAEKVLSDLRAKLG
jgi:hypothetical protein